MKPERKKARREPRPPPGGYGWADVLKEQRPVYAQCGDCPAPNFVQGDSCMFPFCERGMRDENQTHSLKEKA